MARRYNKIKEIIDWRLSYTKGIKDLSHLVTGILEKDEPDLVNEVCKNTQNLLLEIENRRLESQKRKEEIAVALRPADLSFEQKKLLTLEEHLLSNLPEHLVLQEAENHAARYQFAEYMVKAAINHKNYIVIDKKKFKQEIDDFTLDGPIEKIIEESMKYLTAPPQLLKLCRLLDDSDLPLLAIPVTDYAKKVLAEAKQKYKEKMEIKVRFTLLEQEVDRLKKIKKDHLHKIEEIKDLKRQFDKFRLPFTDTPNFDISNYEQIILQIATMRVSCTTINKKRIMDKKQQVVLNKDTLTKKEQAVVDDPKKLETLIQNALSWGIEKGNVEDPVHMMQLAGKVKEYEINYAFSVVEIVRNRLNQLREMQVERKKIDKERELLIEEREMALKNWKLLNDEKAKTLYDFEFQKLLDDYLNPSYYNISKPKIEDLEFSIIKFLLDCIYDKKDAFEDQVNHPNKYPKLPRLTHTQITEERNRFDKLVIDVVSDVEDPNQLMEITKHIHTRKDADSVIKVGEKCQANIGYIEQLRETRAPLQAELDSLIAMKEDLLKRKRPFEKQERVDQLTAMIASLPPWPSYAILSNYLQYDTLGLDIVREMTSAILDNKKILEDDIARMKAGPPENIDEKKIENDRAIIQNKIRQLTKQCLTKFSNPVYLHRFAKDMKSRNETEIVVEIISKCLLKIKEITHLRLNRKPLQLRLEKLTEEMNECNKTNKPFTGKDEMKKIQSQIEKLPLWPHFAQLKQDNQYDQTTYECIEIALNAVLEDQARYEEQLEKQYYNDRPSVDFKKVAQERETKKLNIRKVMEYCFEFILDVGNLQSLIQLLSNKKEGLLMLEICNHLFEQTIIMTDRRKRRDTLKFKIEILTQEKAFLTGRKKKLDEKAEAELLELQKQFEEFQNQEIRLYSQDNAVINSVSMIIIDAVFKKKTQIQAYLNKDLPEQWRPYWIDYNKNMETELLNIIFKYISNPLLLHNIIRELQKLKEAHIAIQVSQYCYRVLGDVREARDSWTKQYQEYTALQQEEASLQKYMKYLPPHKREQLREFMLAEKLRYELPPYLEKNFNPDSFALELSETSLTIATQSPESSNLSSSTDLMEEDDDEESLEEMIDEEAEKNSITEEESEEMLTSTTKEKSKKNPKKPKPSTKKKPKKKEIKTKNRNNRDRQSVIDKKVDKLSSQFKGMNRQALTQLVVELALEHILTIENLIRFAKRLKDSYLYVHLITTGKKCQDRIFDKREEYKKHEEIKEEHNRLDNVRLQMLINKTASKKELEDMDEKIQAVKLALDAIPEITDLENELNKLNTQLLEITEMIILAADVEKLDSEKRAQTIIAFKSDTTTARWDQVRHLTSDEEWLQVKEELVVYVLKQNTQVKDKIELLLKDGLYKQVIEVFPHPSGKEEELDLLLKVYRDIEEKDPLILEKMIPVVSRYMKRYYQEQKYDRMYPILDRFQRRFPMIVISLLAHACDTVMFGILPSQYPSFVQMLKLMKQRLESINRLDDWNAFFFGFKKKHMGKKRLIQMINLLGDSGWDMGSIFDAEKKPKVKEQASETSQVKQHTSTKTDKKKKRKSKKRNSHRKKRKYEKEDKSEERSEDNNHHHEKSPAPSTQPPVPYEDSPLGDRPSTPETESVEEEISLPSQFTPRKEETEEQLVKSSPKKPKTNEKPEEESEEEQLKHSSKKKSKKDERSEEKSEESQILKSSKKKSKAERSEDKSEESHQILKSSKKKSKKERGEESEDPYILKSSKKKPKKEESTEEEEDSLPILKSSKKKSKKVREGELNIEEESTDDEKTLSLKKKKKKSKNPKRKISKSSTVKRNYSQSESS